MSCELLLIIKNNNNGVMGILIGDNRKTTIHENESYVKRNGSRFSQRKFTWLTPVGQRRLLLGRLCFECSWQTLFSSNLTQILLTHYAHGDSFWRMCAILYQFSVQKMCWAPSICITLVNWYVSLTNLPISIIVTSIRLGDTNNRRIVITRAER